MRVLVTATVMSHVAQFHRPLADVVHAHGGTIEVAARDNLAEKGGLRLDWADRVWDVPFSRSPRSRDNVRAYRMLKGIIDGGEYDVVHCNTPMGGVVTRLAAREARRRGTRVIYTAHGFHFYRGASRLAWCVYYPVERLMARMTDTLITINREDEGLARKRFDVDTEYIHGVGVDGNRYHPVADSPALRRELGLDEADRVLLNVGELLPNKNQRLIIEAMPRVLERYPEAMLVIAGNGPLRGGLEARARELGIESRVRFLGYCTCLERWQGVASVLAACSFREGLPLNVVEAMLAGNPVVASRNRGHCELVDDGVTGYIVDPRDDEAMARRLLKLLDDDKLRHRFGDAGRGKALLYTADNVKRELEHIYFDTLSWH